MILKSLLFLSIVLMPFAASASFKECPKLRGQYFCKGVTGSHKDMVMIIDEAFASGRANYHYRYEQVGEKALELDFIASDAGVANPDQDGLVGRCVDGFYFNSDDGRLGPKTLLNTVNRDGNYEVIRNGDRSSFLVCKRRR